MNPRGAKLQFNGPDDKANTDVLIARHSNIIFRGFEVNCTAENGNHTWDCVQVNGWDNNNTEAQNILIENIYAHDSGHSLFGCFRARNVEVRNSTFDMSAHDSEYGEGLYLTSSKRAGSNKPCHNLDFHHNLVGRFGGNSADFKSQTRNCIVRDSIFLDKRIQIDTTDQGGDGDFISQNPQNGTRLAGNYTRDTISYRVIPAYVWKASDGHRMDFINNVVWDYVPSKAGGAKQMNADQSAAVSNGTPEAVSSGNIHCPPGDNISHGPDRDHGGTPNKINRPYSECTTRINEILGTTDVLSCEIGSVNNNTVVVKLKADKNGPVSSVGALQVTYNAANQTENSVTLTSGLEARVVMASAPSSSATVRVTASVGQIKNSAFIGGRNCNMPLSTLATDPGGSLRNPNRILDGRGVCGANLQAISKICTNNVGGGPPPLTEE